jgi:asparagine synthase (glutamine-hydrolysing)
MCGIAGIVSADHKEVIEAMTAALAHRGPDGEGFYEDEMIALGHRRLSIIDLAGGRQPIANEDSSAQLICNGEIYNSPSLRKDLQMRGHRFRTATDVEVILHLYEEYGRDCVRHLRGMFAFAIWDCRRRSLLLARDHLGQKPLFYGQIGEDFLFASEVKGLLASRLLPAQIDLDALWHYVSLRFLPERYSLFSGIRKLPAATVLEWRDGVVQTQGYWRPDFRNKLSADPAQIEEQLDGLLQETVRLHLLSDVRVGAFLSGGIDSGTVAAMMAEASDSPVPAFTIGVREQQFNELPYARMVARRYGMEAHERVVQADLVRLMPAMIHHLDEPADPFGVGVYLAAQMASEKVKVVLCGDGGDENFAGYDRFAGQRLVDYYCMLPDWLRQQVMAPLIARIPDSFGYNSLAQKAAWVQAMSAYGAGERYAQSMSFLRFTSEAKEHLFTENSRRSLGDGDSLGKILCFFNADSDIDLVDRMLYTDLMTRMPDHLLPIVDRMSMAHGLECRPPLMDYRVVEFAAAIPAALKLRGRQLKYILKRVAARHLPSELLRRRKQGFAFPLGLWLRGDLRDFVTRLFASSRFVELGIFERSYLQQLLEEHLHGGIDHNYRIWIIINLEFWYRLYFEGETVDSLQQWTERLMAPSPPSVSAIRPVLQG